jgi:TIR domain
MPGEPKPIFFISHSSGDLPDTDRTVQIRDRLAAILTDRGWGVFLDREAIRSGNRWRENIVFGLSQASAAVILFNEKAISRSNWVPAEGLILCFHKSVDP